ncbi:dTDP-glucose 4,6-dehydratase [Sulfuracidifex metallicus]|uniref:dTDP-glucose 4,6-dehydratase n=1 Tax=Sulfuracidifex metallicus DSM 6482 = JCM 9184 TaxID=523847 RepID=A0A6A9QMQ2_SULME|nr:dTDP-glucose 4,6-dehydratase [Sulfuracidifex metallicus]MUN29429.1 dTDP-glucose 4,6-dehydratase [Sulfuracidifex metallicus DSM 6482 = JCM 9184]WOE50059.1 dTDP-glucose 4,6-dehydratase [Sulfuracidifex metallicus DSM 6482 = JCM 9184]
MKFLVTGGAGFIGSAFIRKVENPVVLDALTYAGRKENLEGVDHVFIKGNISNYDEVKKVVDEYKVDVIVNFAAETHVDRSIVDPRPFLESNVFGVVNLLQIAREKGIRLVHISTDEVYGDNEADENSPLRPSSPYSASKASADMFVLSYVRTYSMDAMIIRPSNNYGPRQFPEKLIPKTIIMTLLGKEVPVYGDGKQMRDWIFVEDTVELIKKVAETGERGRIYNIPGGHGITNIELIDKIGRIMGKEVKKKFVKDRPGHDRFYKMKPSLSYTTMSIDEGLERTVNWYLKNRTWWEPLIKDSFVNNVPWS